MKKILLIFVLPPILASIFIGVHVWILFNQTYSGPQAIFRISPSESFGSVNYRLFKEGYISNSRLFHYYAKSIGAMEKFKAGSYYIEPGYKISDIVETFINGKPILNSVTIAEGKNIYEIAKIFEQNGICSANEFLTTAKDPKILSLIGEDITSLEGYLFPETYKFAPNTEVSTIIKMMITQFKLKTQNLDFSTTNLSRHQVITLASVVEKETGAKHERPAIAGVFHNRLKKKMRLQSDPTTIYGIYETYNGNLQKKHLLEYTPYNTYKIPALPVGPISNPSLEAIKAVLNPEAHNNLYFVSKNDGTHVFNPTYTDHLESVKEWQLNRANRQNKSWRDLKQNK